MVCQMFHKAFRAGQKKPQDSDGVNLYCRQEAHHLVFRHLQQIYDDLNGDSFRQTLGSEHRLHGTLVGDQLPLAQPGNQVPLAQTGNQVPLAQPGNQVPLARPGSQLPPVQPEDQHPISFPIPEIHFSPFNNDLPLDESSRRGSPPPDSYSTDYFTASNLTYSHIRQWLQETDLAQSSPDSSPLQPIPPHVTVIRPSTPGDGLLDTPPEKRRRTRALSLPQGNIQTKSLQGGARRKTPMGSNKQLPEVPVEGQADITMQDTTDLSHSAFPSRNISCYLRIQEASPSSSLKDVPKPRRRGSTITATSTSTQEIRLKLESDLGLLNSMAVIQIDFCVSLLARILSTETPPIQHNLKKLADFLRQKSPEELDKIGVLELEKLYSRNTRLSDRIKKRYNVESVKKLCEEINPTVEVWLDKLHISQVGRLPLSSGNKGIDERHQVNNLSDISDISEGVAGLQARLIGMTAKQIGKMRAGDAENPLSTALQASDTDHKLPYVAPRFFYLRKIHPHWAGILNG